MSTESMIFVGAEALPLSCPMPKTPLWCEHPKVYLNFDASGKAVCPYCGSKYCLEEGVKLNGH
jgi:uncharacterized Zn-finger protein